MTADAAGNLLIADYYNNRVRVVAATSGTFYGQAMTAGDTARSPAVQQPASATAARPPKLNSTRPLG